MEFRPCIDIHDGYVKQIVGGALNEASSYTRENYVSESDAAYFAGLYRERGLRGGHVIILNRAGTEEYDRSRAQALRALAAYPQGLHVGGGINPENASDYLEAGASHVIVTSYVFRDGMVDMDALDRMVSAVGADHLILDLSVRRRDDKYIVVTDRWQKFTSVELTHATLDMLADHCDEFLVHGVDVEGLSAGIESELVGMLGAWRGRPVTYAGGIHSCDDIRLIRLLGADNVNITIGSALDIFGGSMSLDEAVQCCREEM